MSDKSRRDYRNMIQELLNHDYEPTLTDWEINFLESLQEWKGLFTDRQAETLERIWDKVFNDHNDWPDGAFMGTDDDIPF